MPLISNFRYRPEVDGLRAVAVLAVVLFHAGLGVPGGFVGVDVFFVISGFLITSLILKDLQEGKFTLANFWERRARRIIPAVVVVVLATLMAGWFLLLPSDYAALGKSAAWQAVFGANFYFWRHTGYFDKAADEQPLLHTWSLAVEEQFYLVFPLILLGLVASFSVSVLGVHYRPKMAFYWLPFRGWELLCGAVVAILPGTAFLRSKLLREVVCGLGLAAVLAACLRYTKSTPFPGVAALLPCLGTAVFIWGGGEVSEGGQGSLPVTARILALRPVVFVGLISYSLYLWHWPIFAISNYWAKVFGPLSLEYRLSAIAAAFGLATISWKFVETPFRKRRACARRPAMFAAATAGIAALFMAGLWVSWARGFPARISSKALAYAAASEEMGFRYEGSAEDVRKDRLPLIGKGDSEAPVSLLVWGDSHAMAAVPAFDRFLKERGLTGRVATYSSTAPVLDAYWKLKFGLNEKAPEWNEEVFRYIGKKRIPVVVLIGAWRGYEHAEGNKDLETAVLSTIKKLADQGVQAYVVPELPYQKIEVPRFLAAQEVLGLDPKKFQLDAIRWDRRWDDCPVPTAKIRQTGGHVLDPRPLMLDSSGEHYALELDGIPLYRDKHHLTPDGALKVLLPVLEKELRF